MVTKTFGSTMLVEGLEGTRIGVRTPPGLFRHIILYIVDPLSLSQSAGPSVLGVGGVP